MASPSPSPLAGRRIVVTRAVEQSGEIVCLLEQAGAQVLLLPSVAFVEADDTASLDAALRNLATFDWVLFTSANAVRFFCGRAQALGVKLSAAAQDAGLSVAVVGPATAHAAEQHGLRVDFTATRFRGEALAEELAPGLSGKRVLLPRSDRARNNLPEALRRTGALVSDVIAYRTVQTDVASGEPVERIRRGEADMITFASPSAFHSFAEMLGVEAWSGPLARCAMAAIGPTTAAAIREAGIRVEIEASESTAAGLVAAIVAYYSERSSSGAAPK